MVGADKQKVGVELKLHRTVSGSFRILVNGEVKPDLVGFANVQCALQKAQEKYPGIEVDLDHDIPAHLAPIKQANKVLYAICIKATLNTPHRKYVGVDVKNSYVMVSEGGEPEFTNPDNPVDLKDALMYELPLAAAMVMNACGYAGLCCIVPVHVSYTHL
jgi:hypothetical protein